MLTVKQVAHRLGVSKGLVYKLVSGGRLGAYRIGAAIRITEEQVREYLENTKADVKVSPFEVREFRHLRL